MITKIISGGQTGVDRAALDYAIHNKIPHGGWCPKGRLSESGRIPDIYDLKETQSSSYPSRTAKNVASSDGTLIISRGKPEGGTKLTVKMCDHPMNPKPRFIVDALRKPKTEEFVEWVHQHNICVLNVAGPRDRKQRNIGKDVKEILAVLLSALSESEPDRLSAGNNDCGTHGSASLNSIATPPATEAATRACHLPRRRRF